MTFTPLQLLHLAWDGPIPAHARRAAEAAEARWHAANPPPPLADLLPADPEAAIRPTVAGAPLVRAIALEMAARDREGEAADAGWLRARGFTRAELAAAGEAAASLARRMRAAEESGHRARPAGPLPRFRPQPDCPGQSDRSAA